MTYLARITVAMALLVAMAGCASSGSDAAADVEVLEQQLTQVVAERDSLAAQLQPETGRRDRARQIMDELVAILDDHEAYGTEDEVVDTIATHATEDAVMDDDVFGPYPYREAFYNTLYFGGAEAHIDVYASWLSDDGTQGGFLWMWSGTNTGGHPFELGGISLIDFAEDGRIAYERVTYPYPDEYVYEAWMGDGTEILSTG
jgi:hypothetical protein